MQQECVECLTFADEQERDERYEENVKGSKGADHARVSGVWAYKLLHYYDVPEEDCT